jgi:hypothetical protein
MQIYRLLFQILLVQVARQNDFTANITRKVIGSKAIQLLERLMPPKDQNSPQNEEEFFRKFANEVEKLTCTSNQPNIDHIPPFVFPA